MNDSVVASSMGASAGAMLRAARETQGLHIAALAAAIKVPQKKLEALESDRFDELPDATFTRALAQTVCRSLKIDPAPVLARLPQLTEYRLEQLGEGINAPFRERPGRGEPDNWANLTSPAVWAPLLLMIAAALVYFLPSGWLSAVPVIAPAPQPASAAASIPLVPADRVSETVPTPATSALLPADTPPASQAVEAPAPASAPALPVAAAASSVLQVRSKAASWVEVMDARSQVLLSRSLEAGETVSLDGALPFRVKVGNAAATELVFRGQPLDLSASTRDNVARLELK
jgi:cytoskeleton protein RodZ